MPISKNNGRYGQLGHWGKRNRKPFSKRKVLLLVSLLSLSLIFAISKNGGPIGFVNGDYNSSYSHTRTPIFQDTIFQNVPSGATFDFLVGAGAGVGGITGCGGGCTSPQTASHAVSSGEALIIILDANAGCGAFTITDSQSNTYTTQVCSAIATIIPETMQIFTTFASSTGTDTWTVSFSSTISFFGTFGGYTGVASITSAQSAISTTMASTGTVILGTSNFNGLMFAHFQFWNNTGGSITPNGNSRQSYTSMNAPIFYKAGSNDVTGQQPPPEQISWGWSGMSCPVACYTNIGSINLNSVNTTPLGSPSVRWNYNTTCVTVNALIKFDYSLGSAGGLGNNCSTADIAITKAPVNLQTAAGRMLEMVTGWNNAASSKVLNFTVILRTNGTLPGFLQSYNPFIDAQARLIWTTTFTGNQSLYIARDQSKTVSQEGFTNDLVIRGNSFLNTTNFAFNEQVVLNFTGAKNFMGSFASGSTTTNSNNTASGLQFGQDFYIVVMSDFAGAPCGGCSLGFDAISAIPGGSPSRSFGVFSVPASCNDPVNTTPCSLAAAQPVFQFNPLDPSSWGNAIIKGLLWVFTVAVPQGFVIVTSVLAKEIQLVGNFIGQNIGWGNVGDNIVTFFAGFPSYFGQIGTALGWLASLVSTGISGIGVANLFTNPYFTGLANVLNDFKNAIGSSLIISMITQIAFWFPTSYMVILIFFYFLFVFTNGLRGFFDWLHLVKWSSFQFFDLFARILDAFIALVTAILGRLSVISPGHKFPKIPQLKAGSLPKVSLSGEMAFFDDPTAWFLAFTGFIFTMMWAGTSAAGLPANTQTIIQSMSTLFLTLFGAGFMILLLYIPGFLLAKLYQKGIVS